MDRATQIQRILASCSLSLYRVSQLSAELFGHHSEFYLPHNLYATLEKRPRLPTLSQLFALSRISNYRIYDWLAAFGFDVEASLRILPLASRKRTTILDSTVYDPLAWIPWFAGRIPGSRVPYIAPLRHLLAKTPPVRAEALAGRGASRFVYATIGEGDIYCRAHFARGTVIRADPRLSAELAAHAGAAHAARFYLIEHEAGWTCSRILPLGKDRLLLHCPECPYAECELRLGSSARILGAVDAEIRPLKPRFRRMPVAKPGTLQRSRPGAPLGSEMKLGDLLRQYRTRAGLSFREASALSREMSRALSDGTYFAAPSTLSDYETLSRPPRQIKKVMALCAVYGIEFERLLRAGGLALDQAGREPMPDALLARQTPARMQAVTEQKPAHAVDLPGSMWEAWEEIPLFLRFWLDEITGIRNTSLNDVFWVGGEQEPRHPMLTNAVLAAVNRRARKLVPRKAGGSWGGPPHMILLRDGEYLCGRCTLDRGSLVVEGYPRGGISTREFRNRIDAEVVGEVTAVLRRLR